MELKPCPFCGRAPVLVSGANWYRYDCECTNSETQEEALIKWNNRTPVPLDRERMAMAVHKVLEIPRPFEECTDYCYAFADNLIREYGRTGE